MSRIGRYDKCFQHLLAFKILIAFTFVGNQLWDYIPEAKTIVHRNSGWCLDKGNARQENTLLMVNPCDGRKSQSWTINSNFKWQAPNHMTTEETDEYAET